MGTSTAFRGSRADAGDERAEAEEEATRAVEVESEKDEARRSKEGVGVADVEKAKDPSSALVDSVGRRLLEEMAKGLRTLQRFSRCWTAPRHLIKRWLMLKKL